MLIRDEWGNVGEGVVEWNRVEGYWLSPDNVLHPLANNNHARAIETHPDWFGIDLWDYQDVSPLRRPNLLKTEAFENGWIRIRGGLYSTEFEVDLLPELLRNGRLPPSDQMNRIRDFLIEVGEYPDGPIVLLDEFNRTGVGWPGRGWSGWGALPSLGYPDPWDQPLTYPDDPWDQEGEEKVNPYKGRAGDLLFPD